MRSRERARRRRRWAAVLGALLSWPGSTLPAWDAGGGESTEALAARLAASDGSTDDARLASILDRLRARGRSAAPAAEPLGSLLHHRSRIFAERDKAQVVRLRAYILVTLAEIGFPSSALPALLDTLAHPDPRQPAMELGAAVRAVGSLGPPGCAYAPLLLDLVGEPSGEEEFSLERYEPRFPPAEATTVQLEALRALGAACGARDAQVVAALRALADHSGAGLDPRAVREAKTALARVLAR